MIMPIESALSMRGARVFCNGARLWVIVPGWGYRYAAPYAVTISNLAAVRDAGMACELRDPPNYASEASRALVVW